MKMRRDLTALLFIALAPSALAGPGHEHAPAAPAAEPTAQVTRWTDTMELFMEFPMLTTDRTGEFVVHLTVLEGFQPARDGTVALRFRDQDGAVHAFTADAPVRDGVFLPSVHLPHAGVYAFELAYRGPGLAADFPVGDYVVSGGERAVPAPAPVHGSDDIGFLKEQQWQVPFATTRAEVRDIKRSVWAIGEVLPAPLAYAEIDMPVDGVVEAGSDADLALPGSRVRAGDVVARIRPSFRGEGWATSRLAFEQAERNYERARRLRDRDAISQREYEEARNEYLVEQARQERLSGGDAGALLDMTAPIDGKVFDWQVRPGQRLKAGDHLMAIADPGVVWLQVNVYERDFRGLGIPVGAFIGSGGADGGWSVPTADLRVLTTGGALDPVTRTIPVLLEITNTAGRLTINETTPVELSASEGTTATAVPRSAVYDDDGLDVVFVQTGGETFAKRVVQLGPRHADWVSVLAGLEPGERVVTRGGYHVKLASTSAEIGHGHAH